MTTLIDLLEHRARIHPELMAVEDISCQITYREYVQLANQLAHYLLELGVQHGDRVAMLSRNHSTMPINMCACAAIGAILVPLNSRQTSTELSWILNNCEAKVLIYEDQFESLLTPELYTSVKHLIRFGAERPIKSLLHIYPDQRPDVPVSETDPMVMIYTSGTTGKPKGVVITHKNLRFVCQNFAIEFEVRYQDRLLLVTPLFHISGIMLSILCIVRGMTLILHPTFHPAEIWDLIDQKHVTVMMAVPTMLTIMLETLKSRDNISESLRDIYSGGSQVPPNLIKAYADFGYSIQQVYALTETTCYLTRWSHHFGLENCHSLGKPSYLVEVKIIDPETGEELPPGEVGEIVTRGDHIFQGYWNNPEETEKVFKDGWFLTKDAGYLDKNGFLYIMDRLKDMIACGGEKVYPAQVEMIIRELEQVQDVAVIGVPDPVWVEIPRAYVVLKEGTALTEDEILAYVHGKISSYKLQQVRIIKELPKNSMGKTLKYKLREEAKKEQMDG